MSEEFRLMDEVATQTWMRKSLYFAYPRIKPLATITMAEIIEEIEKPQNQVKINATLMAITADNEAAAFVQDRISKNLAVRLLYEPIAEFS